MPSRVRQLLEEGALSWNRAKAVCRAIQEAPAGEERKTLERELGALERGPGGTPGGASQRRVPRPLTLQLAKKRLQLCLDRDPKATFTLSAEDLMSLLLVIEGKQYEDRHVSRVKRHLPVLMQ